MGRTASSAGANPSRCRGKHRPKLDIEIEHQNRGTPPGLGFQAKRLGPSHGVCNFLGEEGLLAFINGYYPTIHGETGMLGYVQSRTPAAWHQDLTAALTSSHAKYHSRIASHSMHIKTPNALLFCSDHAGSVPELQIIHHLLSFRQRSLEE